MTVVEMLSNRKRQKQTSLERTIHHPAEGSVHNPAERTDMTPVILGSPLTFGSGP
jgi:hypothetical protein